MNDTFQSAHIAQPLNESVRATRNEKKNEKKIQEEMHIWWKNSSLLPSVMMWLLCCQSWDNRESRAITLRPIETHCWVYISVNKCTALGLSSSKIVYTVIARTSSLFSFCFVSSFPVLRYVGVRQTYLTFSLWLRICTHGARFTWFYARWIFKNVRI